MKTFKKILATILCVVMVFGSAPLGGFVGLDLPSLFDFKAEAATYSGTCGDNLNWSLNTSTGVLKITGTGAMKEWSSNSLVPWYSYRESIKSVTIGNGVTSIGRYAFYCCIILRSITIPDSVTTIGVGAFSGCDSLASVTIPDSVTTIGGGAFSGCDSLASVTIPDSVTTIGNGAFSNCTSLKSITIPDSVTSIGEDAFYNCNSLENVYYTGDLADWCRIESSNYYSNPMYYADNFYINGVLVEGDVVIPDGATSIGSYAFCNCKSLTSVTIPDSVTSIGSSAFYKCTSLTNVTIGNGVTSIGGGAFSGCTSLTSITIPDDVTSIGSSAFSGCTSLTNVTIGNGVTSIGGDAFCGCTSLTSISIPDSVTSIGRYAFENCTSLTSITIPDDVTSIGVSAFENTAIYDNSSNWVNNVLYIGNHLIEAKTTLSGAYSVMQGTKVIADYAFSGCTSLTSVSIPDSVTKIGRDAFYNCSGLKNITIPDTVTSIGSYAFDGCTSLTNVTIGNGVTSIGGDAFSCCTSLTSITIPDSVTSIGSSAFYKCTSLTSVTIGNNVTSIGGSAFKECTSLTSVTIGNNVTSIGGSAFYSCSNITDIYYTGDLIDWCAIEFEDSYSNPICDTAKIYVNGVLISGNFVIPDNVTSIGDYAFYGYNGFTSVTISDSVTSLGEDAFKSCDNLLNVIIGNGITEISDTCFWRCQSLRSVIIGTNVTHIGHSAFFYCDNLKDVYYTGSADEWKKIIISENNDSIKSATKHYDFYMPDEFISGTCGENITWSLDKSTGELVINGNGKLENLTNEYNVPSIVLGSMTKSITISKGITEINGSIFRDFSCFDTIYYSGTMEEWQSITTGSYSTKNIIYEYDTDNANYGSGSCGNNLTWKLDLDGNLIIEGSGAIPNYSESSVPWYSVREKIRNIYIPAGVTNIGASVFNGCTNVESFSVDENNYYFSTDENGVLFNYDKTKLIKYPAKSSKTEYIIPESVTSIRPYAFENALNLTTVSFGSDVSEICENAFIGCTNISLIKYAGTVTEWVAITIGEGNDALNQKMIYESGTPDAKYASGSCGTNLTWVLYENGSLVISGTGAMTNSSSLWTDYRDYILTVSFPDGITHIGNGTFSFCKNIESITLPSSVTSIGDTAFAECDKLKTVSVPYGVKTIGADAFRDCDLLESFIMPDSVTTLGDSVFYMCDSLKNVTLSKNIKTIDDYTFYKCSSLESIVIPDNVTYIGYYAFNYCSQLNELTMPVTARIYNSRYVFSGCTGIDKITLTKGTTGIMLDYGTSTSTSSTTPNYKFTPWYISEPSEIVIAEGVKYLGVLAFYECFESLNSLTLPQSLNEIGEHSFYYINHYTNLYYNGTIYDWCNVYINDKGTLYDAENVNPAYYADNFYINGERLEGDLVIPDGVTSIDYKTFVGINSITSVTIPDSVTEIGYKAFYYCEGLTDVKIGNGVKTIGDNAFHGCSNITNLIIGNSVESIGNKAFKYCRSLKELTIPVTAKIYNSNDTFNECKNLDKVTFTKGTTGVMLDYGENLPETSSIIDYSYTPWGMSKCKEIIIEDGVKSIGDYAFCNQSSLTSISIPDSVTTIGEYAFYNCNSLTSITIPDGVTSIDKYAFYNCSGLTSITIPDRVATIGYASFYGCEGIKELTMPVSAKISNSSSTFGDCINIDKIIFTKGTGAMPDYASTSTSPSTTYYKYTPWYISGCSEIVLPQGVSTIGTYAFHECSNLKTVTYEGTVDEYYEIVIKDYNEPLFNAKTNFQTYMIMWIYGDKTEKVLMKVGDQIVPPTVEAEEGYQFAGWDNTVPETMPAENLVFTADWTVKSYDVIWVVDGKETKEAYPCGSTINKPANPVKEGYTFTGWDNTIPETMPAENLVFTALWTANSYDVVWVVDGAETKETYTYGSKINTPANPVKEGYTFTGWGSDIPATMPANKLTFTAQWSINSYNVTWIVDGVETKQVYKYGDKITAPAAPTKEGHVFVSWSKAVPATMPAEDLTFTVVWDTLAYDVTWIVDGVETKETYNYGTAINTPAAPTKEGYTFTGWDNEIPATMPANQLTFTAQWSINSYDVIWIVDGVETKQTYQYGADVASLVNPSKEGYTFTGWSREVPTTMPAENITITAQWRVNIYTVTWTVDGKTTVNNVAFGSNIVKPSTPVKVGYKFIGWTPVIPGVMPAENLEFTAQFELMINQLKIKNPSTGTVKYGETLVLHADVAELPEGYSIQWTVEGSGFSMTTEENGMKCKVTSVANGNASVKATLVDENGEAVLDANGNEMSDSKQLKSDASFWQKIVSFFKNLFRVSRIILQ